MACHSLSVVSDGKVFQFNKWGFCLFVFVVVPLLSCLGHVYCTLSWGHDDISCVLEACFFCHF